MGKTRVFNLDKVVEEFEEVTKNAAQVQRETLRKILEQNGEVEYLRNFDLNGRTDPESFKSCVPLVTHADLEPYFQRIVDGDTSKILTEKPVTALSLSSGTTNGRSKFLIFNDEMLQSSMQIYRTSFAFINREYPIGEGKALQFIYSSKQIKTKGGLIATTGTTNIYKSKQFKSTMKEIQSQCCSPEEVIFSPDFDQALYCHLLCGLIYSNDVQYIASAFAHSIVHAFRTFEQIWEELCENIRYGVLSDKITDQSVRLSVSKILHPNPELADTIEQKCAGLSNWYGLIPELWPNAKYVYGIMTGSMEPYVRKLRHYAKNLPLLSAYYGASEGWIAANVNPRREIESVAYAVFPNISYFEFIPVIGENEETVGLTEVEIGKEYEVVITSSAGLYRYKLGDIVKVTGFHNSTPELQFVCRKNLLLTINIDKNTEKDLQAAVEKCSQLLSSEKIEVVDFTSYIDLSSEPGHYVIFLELSSDVEQETLNDCCDCLDAAFVDVGYVGSRKAHGIGPLELRVVKRGTFERIMEHYFGKGATVSQFKMPRCVRESNGEVLEILCGNVVRGCFSTAY
ncbi:jasmonic acid-amido synthetase JAR1-like [Asparagus officinalis]|uniref:jasmonic acid-amido synthetase JAR1-like n=1 Tax=Asparagus officinalis TaxID=4686 RepID=UPI00098E5DCB|nr:jasmonic acid-amido synthetase JAR1-like [Asparagus officinalis]